VVSGETSGAASGSTLFVGAAGRDGLRRIEVRLGEDRSYPVVVGRGWLEDLAVHVPLPPSARRALVVTQEPVVAAGHVAPVEAALEAAGLEVAGHLVPDGEAAKTIDVLGGIWRAVAQVPLTRGDLVVAVGGGVVGDLAGFAAATYARGIAVLQVPTTLLAQVDAAIGGKTGINLPEGKNLVGAFHQPVAVACDVGVLGTVPPRVLLEGFGEVVKYGLIHDHLVLERLEQRTQLVRGDDLSVLEELVARSAAAKAKIVAADERESGVRAYLNFGHTYGHAVETLTGYDEVLHGEAVAIGMVVALRLGERLGHTPLELRQRAEHLIGELGLPVRGPSLDREAVWEVMARDKKAGPDGVRFVVLDGVAAPRVITPERRDVDAVLDELGV
jgi:3-dehydroquinate synthase